MNLFNFSNNNLDELVFEQRNKAYGAYAIRKAYTNTLNKSMLIALSPLLLILVAGLIWNKKHPVQMTTKNDLVSPTVCPGVPEIIELTNGFTFVLENPLALFSIVPDKKLEHKPRPKENIAPIAAQGLTTSSLGIAGTQATGIQGALPGIGSVPGTLGVGGPKIIEFTAEVMPEFPGGNEALYEYIRANLKYPRLAVEQGIQGKVVVSFVVMADGSVQMSNLERSIGFGCDEEAMRVVKEMPKWTPARQNGQEVPVRMVLPVVFQTN